MIENCHATDSSSWVHWMDQIGARQSGRVWRGGGVWNRRGVLAKVLRPQKSGLTWAGSGR